MEDLNSCDCYRLLRTLEDERLPDHLCWDIVQTNVRIWVIETQAGRSAYRADAFHDPLTTPQPSTADGNASDEHVLTTFQVPWPQRYDGRDLIFVLRQWVQEEPSETLANLLANH